MTKDAPPLEATRHDERRRDQRYQLRAPGLVADKDGVHDCIVADISIGGAMIEGDLPLEQGQEIALAFDSLIGILGEVVHKGDGFLGVKFTGGPDQRLIVMDWVGARLRTARPRAKR